MNFVSGRIYFTVGRTKPKIILDGYDFKFQRNMCESTYWTCTFYEKTKCKSRLKTKANIVFVTGSHNHSPKEVNLTNCSFKDVKIKRKGSYFM